MLLCFLMSWFRFSLRQTSCFWFLGLQPSQWSRPSLSGSDSQMVWSQKVFLPTLKKLRENCFIPFPFTSQSKRVFTYLCRRSLLPFLRLRFYSVEEDPGRTFYYSKCRCSLPPDLYHKVDFSWFLPCPYGDVCKQHANGCKLPLHFWLQKAWYSHSILHSYFRKLLQIWQNSSYPFLNANPISCLCYVLGKQCLKPVFNWISGYLIALKYQFSDSSKTVMVK